MHICLRSFSSGNLSFDFDFCILGQALIWLFFLYKVILPNAVLGVIQTRQEALHDLWRVFFLVLPRCGSLLDAPRRCDWHIVILSPSKVCLLKGKSACQTSDNLFACISQLASLLNRQHHISLAAELMMETETFFDVVETVETLVETLMEQYAINIINNNNYNNYIL